MRSFSALNRYCAYGEVVDFGREKPYPVRVMGDAGNVFHGALQARVDGRSFDLPDREWPKLLRGDPRKWFLRMCQVWTPPDGCRAEVPLGITGDGRGVDVIEDPPDSHHYVPVDPADQLITSGRLDLLWEEGGVLHVPDAKSGRKYLGGAWTVPQLMAQGYAAAKRYGKPVRLGVYYARLGLFDWDEVREVEAVEKLFEDVVRFATMDNLPRPGPWCAGCNSGDDCDANPARQVDAIT